MHTDMECTSGTSGCQPSVLLLPTCCCLLLCQVSTTYRGQATSDVVPHHIALDPAVPGRLYASDSRASAIYVWDGPEAGKTP